jgi:glycerol uptake facilitator-like aquaporin
MAMCYRITGAHLNPIITVVQLLRRDKKQSFEYVLAFLYVFAQYLGHFCGVALTWWYTTTPYGLLIANNGNMWYYSDAVGQEWVASFIFVLIYLHQTSEVSMLSKETALQLLVIAGTYASCVAWSFYKAGGSINPAFGFASNFWDQMKRAGADPFKFIWLYTVIPFFGAAFAFAVHHLIVLPGNRDAKDQEKIAQH